ncbi:MAG TPA: ADOP family duplicated permease [Thermoanaerobaculia bacterium]|nr:ADOP family duplicated permease [Thermoanaerobaculia bacterium]
MRQAARGLRRRPLFTLTAGVSIALAIAGNAAVFSLADALLLRPRPGIVEPERLVDVGRSDRGGGFDTFSYPTFVDLRDRNQVFTGLAAYDVEPSPLGLAVGGGAVRVHGGVVSGNYFEVLGTSMALGRAFLPEEDRPGAAEMVTVIGHALWRERFAAEPQVLGRVVRLNGRPFTVVGVAPPGFEGSSVVAVDLWVPAAIAHVLEGRSADSLSDRRGAWLVGIGRLRPGVTVEQAQAAMRLFGEELARAYPTELAGQGLVVTRSHRLPGALHGLVGGFVGLLAALVLVVLLVACSNVAGMLLARGLERSREVAVRLAMGGSRVRIVSQLLAESLLLASAGAAGGLLGAFAMTRVLARLQPVLPLRLALDVRVDARVVAFSLGFTFLAALAAGLVPALRAVRTDPARALRAQSSSPARSHGRLLQGFVLAQVAMSVLLAVSGLLLARGLSRARDVDPGFEAAGVELAELDLRLAGYTAESGPAFAEQLLERSAHLPAVRAAAWTRVVPLGGSGMGMGALRVPGAAADAPSLEVDWNVVSPSYFSTLRVPVVRGRSFTDADRTGAPLVAIVNETLARRAWGSQDPIGKTLVQDENGDGEPHSLLVVGVARDGKYRSLGEDPRAFIYVTLAQHYTPELTLLVRSAPGTSSLPSIRSLLREMDPALPLVGAASLPERAAVGLLPQRLAASLGGGSGVLGLLLAAIGIYGMTAFAITQRRREIGIRAALGASHLALLRVAAARSWVVVAAGAAVGIAIAAALARVLGSLLFGLPTLDPVSFLGVPLLLAAMAAAASWLASHRVIARAPAEVLKSE